MGRRKPEGPAAPGVRVKPVRRARGKSALRVDGSPAADQGANSQGGSDRCPVAPRFGSFFPPPAPGVAPRPLNAVAFGNQATISLQSSFHPARGSALGAASLPREEEDAAEDGEEKDPRGGARRRRKRACARAPGARARAERCVRRRRYARQCFRRRRAVGVPCARVVLQPPSSLLSLARHSRASHQRRCRRIRCCR